MNLVSCSLYIQVSSKPMVFTGILMRRSRLSTGRIHFPLFIQFPVPTTAFPVSLAASPCLYHSSTGLGDGNVLRPCQHQREAYRNIRAIRVCKRYIIGIGHRYRFVDTIVVAFHCFHPFSAKGNVSAYGIPARPARYFPSGTCSFRAKS